MKFLLDTNAIAEPCRKAPSAAFLRRLREHTGALIISSVTWHEALYGMHRMPEGKRKQAVRDYLSDVVRATMSVLPYDATAADWHARERARLGARGKTVPFADGQIAAVAATNGATLVTANIRDFRVFDGLRVEDWSR